MKILRKKLCNHHSRLGAAQHLRLGIAPQHLAERRAVVRLHMLYDHKMQRLSRQRLCEIFQKEVAHGMIHRVE